MLRALVVLIITAASFVFAQGASAANLTLSRMPIDPAIEVRYEPCPDYPDLAGCAFAGHPVVYVRQAGDMWFTFHELGHKFAERALGDALDEHSPLSGASRKFARMTRASARALGEPRSVITVREQLADAYASCAFGDVPSSDPFESDGFPTGNGYDPTPRAHRQVCAMLRRAGLRAGLRVP